MRTHRKHVKSFFVYKISNPKVKSFENIATFCSYEVWKTDSLKFKDAKYSK